MPALSVRSRAAVVACLAALACVSASACVYTFHGGGLPPEIKTVAVLPFENETTAPEVQRELTEGLRKAFASRLGLREAAEDKASAIVRGTIVRYELDAPIGVSANPAQPAATRRRLQMVVDIEIVDQVRGRTLWARKGITASGDYAENDEASGRRQAVERIVNDVIEGAQSQW